MTPRWSDDRYPYLAFVPVQPRFDQPPFDILRCVGSHFPVAQAGPKWVVEPKLVQLWQKLENNLRLIGDILHTPPAPYSSLFEETFPLPSSFGFERKHNSNDLLVFFLLFSLQCTSLDHVADTVEFEFHLHVH